MSILNAASHGTHPPQTISPFPPLAFFFFGTVVTLVVMTTKNGPQCQHSWTATHFVVLSGSGDWGVLTGIWVSPPDQRATVKACLDDHSAGLRAFFWVFMLLWVVRTLTQLVECGHTVQYGDSPVSRDIVLCLWYKEKKIHVVMMRYNNFFPKDPKRPCVGLWNSLVSRESDASSWCY